MMATWTDTPLTRCATASLPVLLRAHDVMHGLAAPRASRIAERISAALEELIECAGDAEAYGNTWSGGEMGEIAAAAREATREWRET
jgi:hypothetical protein